MKKFLIAALLAGAASGAMAQNVGVDIHLGGPGYYGNIELGNAGPPPVIYRQPLIIERDVRYVGAPMYLRVPPGHAKHWGQHCRAYNACGRPVYFVQDNWYHNTYAPNYRRMHGAEGWREGRREERHEERREERHEERRDARHDQHGYDQHDKHDRHDDRGERDRDDEHGHGKH